MVRTKKYFELTTTKIDNIKHIITNLLKILPCGVEVDYTYTKLTKAYNVKVEVYIPSQYDEEFICTEILNNFILFDKFH